MIRNKRDWRWWLKHHKYREQKGMCHYCRDPMTIGEVTLDHVIPHSKGGGLTIRNTVAACLECNHAKADHDVASFQQGWWLKRARSLRQFRKKVAAK